MSGLVTVALGIAVAPLRRRVDALALRLDGLARIAAAALGFGPIGIG